MIRFLEPSFRMFPRLAQIASAPTLDDIIARPSRTMREAELERALRRLVVATGQNTQTALAPLPFIAAQVDEAHSHAMRVLQRGAS